MRRVRMLPVVLVGVLAVLGIAGAVAATGHGRRVLRAAEHRAAVAHPRLAMRGQRRPALARGAADGGHVIVVLKQTNSGVSLARGLAQRRAVDATQQAPIVSNIKQSGGNSIRQLTLVNAVAANVSANEAQQLASMGNVSQVLPDQQVTETVPLTPTATNVAPAQAECTSNPNQPMIEPEALESMHFEGPGSDEADKIAETWTWPDNLGLLQQLGLVTIGPTG